MNTTQARALEKASSVPTLPSIGSSTGARVAPSSSASAKALRGPPPTDAGKAARRNWASEQRRLIHQSRERQWLRSKAKYGYIDFSDTERAELRRYFNALTGQSGRVGIDKLENMLISLGLAADRREVASIVERIDSSCTGELDFEQYLEIVRTRTDSNIFQVFKAMMEGKLGDRNLNFQTVISTYRRQLILNATGADGAKGEQQELGERILGNFAALQRSRHKAHHEAHRAEPLDFAAQPHGGPASIPEPSFELGGQAAPLGKLEMVWRGVCREHGLVSSRPASADGRSRHALEKPLSPTQVVAAIVRARPDGKQRRSWLRGSTVIVDETAALQDGGGRRLSANVGQPNRGPLQAGPIEPPALVG